MRYVIFALLLVGCTREDSSSYSTSMFQTGRKAIVAILPMEDCTETNLSTEIASALSQAVVERIEQKNPFNLATSRTQARQFLVTMQLIQHQESVLNPSELTVSVHLKILDLRSDKPKVILQEVLNHNTLLEMPLRSTDLVSWSNEAFRVSPMGLIHSKLSREIATRIEDYITLATKG